MSTISEAYLPVDTAVDRSQVAIIVPTVNAQRFWTSLTTGLRLQAFPPSQVLIVDSSSDDGTREFATAEGYGVVRIDRRDFNHGGTRQFALDLVPWASVVVFLTQDAMLAAPDSVDRLLSAFEDPTVAAAYGRQLPRLAAGPIEAHARLFNYPPRSEVRDFESRHKLGIKAAFLSNSFAAYRMEALTEVGGFPSDAIVAEDSLVSGKLLLAGWKVAYVAEAQAYHSHAFTVREEFRRYFDIGVCHRREPWLRQQFGRTGSEGGRFVRSELRYLFPRHLHLVPIALFRSVTKALGYQLGLHGARLGRRWSRRLSYQRNFWDGAAGVSGDLARPHPRSKLPTSGPASLS
jgi:rhamnosyltransferase